MLGGSGNSGFFSWSYYDSDMPLVKEQEHVTYFKNNDHVHITDAQNSPFQLFPGTEPCRYEVHII
jgi:hypothetical protein